MKLSEILNEKAVESSWITDLVYNRPNRVLTMRVSNGRTFSIANISRAIFDQWANTPSKGRYFHNRIKDNYKVSRIK